MDQLSSMVGFLENKTILVTGATGFLAKVFVEKILRIQPHIKLFLLLKAKDSASALKRLHGEILSTDLFRVLRERSCSDLNYLISERVIVPIAGDVLCEDMGVNDLQLKNEMWNEVDIVVNMAATVKFDERYDIALAINTMGPIHTLNFANKCANLKVFIHVSTAYVCGEREGVVDEMPFKMGETLNGRFDLDINLEFKIMEENLNNLKERKLDEPAITAAMKDFGLKRARSFGWPNTYVFTKAMGEMLIGESRGNMPLVILRPTIVSSTIEEPFPGWIEGVRTVDSVAIAYGKGRIKCFIGDLNSILDLIPADMVASSIIVAISAHADKPGVTIYHLGSSSKNPLKLSSIVQWCYMYFSQHPLIGMDGKTVMVRKFKLLNTMKAFHKYLSLHYIIPLKMLKLANIVSFHYFESFYSNAKRKIYIATRMVELLQILRVL
uniref:Fatty acyl-CoA reductase n=1 Tax=Kalanchoe fedtschenkoi TaxID=63787 RepID=A0A7N0VJK8_KALFE